MNVHNKLECMCMASLPSPASNFQVSPEPTRVRQISSALLQGRLLALPTNIKTSLKRDARDKHSSLLRPLENYDHKKFYNIGLRRGIYKILTNILKKGALPAKV
jgi:hypothetical protein